MKDISKSGTSLKHTLRSVDVENVAGGDFVYVTLKSALSNYVKCFREPTEFNLIVNVGGTRIYNSKKKQMWPILCTVNQQGPYTIALWYGKGKPTILREYLEKFVAEINFFFINGYVGLKVMVKAFVCDASARAFLKCIKGHSGYDSCERCQEHGQYNKDIRLLGTKSLLRDDKKLEENFYLKH
ncbi:uncharacterized protein LOC124811269 [Hydra vulgaris]|uniref:uncharacterized protein LOC124811269 n=1 Tax=Hydra vulgaris TaxID=6087 RepID=UPI001F5F2823|nr:uncharacterized protein LOC124811269 [Hydra vulgaris]